MSEIKKKKLKVLEKELSELMKDGEDLATKIENKIQEVKECQGKKKKIKIYLN